MKVDWNDVKEDYARKDAEIERLKARLDSFNSDLECSQDRIKMLQDKILKCNPIHSGDWHDMTALVLELKAAEDENALIDTLMCNMDLAEENINKVFTAKVTTFTR